MRKEVKQSVSIWGSLKCLNAEGFSLFVDSARDHGINCFRPVVIFGVPCLRGTTSAPNRSQRRSALVFEGIYITNRAVSLPGLCHSAFSAMRSPRGKDLRAVSPPVAQGSRHSTRITSPPPCSVAMSGASFLSSGGNIHYSPSPPFSLLCFAAILLPRSI